MSGCVGEAPGVSAAHFAQHRGVHVVHEQNGHRRSHIRTCAEQVEQRYAVYVPEFVRHQRNAESEVERAGEGDSRASDPQASVRRGAHASLHGGDQGLFDLFARTVRRHRYGVFRVRNEPSVSVGDDGFEKRPSDIEKQFPVIRRRIHL